jgi:thymidylate kinase
MPFVVLEGFSGTGKTTLAKALERQGWLRLQESAHAVPRGVPVAERADTFADFSLLGATLVYSSIISNTRSHRKIVSEGYLLSDLAYARIRYDLEKSTAFPAMLAICRELLANPSMKPDLYVLLEAEPDTIEDRQRRKGEREKNVTKFFRTRYYSALDELHRELGETKVERVRTDSDAKSTLEKIISAMEKRRVIGR